MSDNSCVSTDSRRHFLQAALSSAVVGAAVQAGFEFFAPTPLNAQSNLTPDAACCRSWLRETSVSQQIS